MTTTTRAKPAAKPASVSADLRAGSPVLLPDGGEALVIGVEAGDALLRCGTLHDAPVRVPADQVSKVAAGAQTERHDRFMVEARRRGEL
jgi:hypothetical protein